MFMLELLLVFALGFLELWIAIPTGLAIGVNPVATGFVSIVGAICGALIMARVGEALRDFIKRRYGWDISRKRGGIIYRIWMKYGIIGFSLMAPFLTGAPLGTILGISLGAPRKKLLSWISFGVILWGIGITAAAVMGMVAIESFFD